MPRLKKAEPRYAETTLEGELEGITVTVRTNPPVRVFADVNPSVPSSWVGFFLETVMKWDATDDDGKIIEITEEELRSLTIQQMLALQEGVTGIIQNPPSQTNETS